MDNVGFPLCTTEKCIQPRQRQTRQTRQRPVPGIQFPGHIGNTQICRQPVPEMSAEMRPGQLMGGFAFNVERKLLFGFVADGSAVGKVQHFAVRVRLSELHQLGGFTGTCKRVDH